MDVFFITCIGAFLGFLSVIIYKWFTHEKQAVDGVKILKILNQNKIFPLCPSNKWTLWDYILGTRIWRRTFPELHTNVFGCCGLVKKYPKSYTSTLLSYPWVPSCQLPNTQSLLDILTNVNKLCEWDPTVRSVSHVSADSGSHSSSDTTRHVQYSFLPVICDMIEVDRKSALKFVLRLLNNFFTKFFHVGLPLPMQVYQRLYFQEENGCCWLLESEVMGSEWTFYLAQPVEGLDKSLLTIVFHPSSNWLGSAPSTAKVVKRLGCLRDFFQMKHLQPIPNKVFTLPNLETVLSENGDNAQYQRQRTASGSSSGSMKRRRGKVKMRSHSEVVKGSPHTAGADAVHRQTSEISAKSAISTQKHAATEDCIDEVFDKDVDKVSESTKIFKIGTEDDSPHTSHHDNSEEGKRELEMSNVLTSDLDSREYIIPSLTNDETGLKKAHVLANQTAAELFQVAMQASNIDVKQPELAQAEKTKGWIFQSVEKEVVVLRKDVNLGMRSSVQCYLGKGLIKLPAAIVWDAVKNPRTRFTYDELLKKLDIIHDFEDGLKIIRLQHEISWMFSTEYRDFCLIHGERKEQDKYILSMLSVNWPGCKPQDENCRGTFLASGWIVEPVAKQNGKEHSMVTYMVQMDVKSTHSAPMDEIVTRQPTSIAALRSFLEETALVTMKIKRTI
ncbi:uncharacterized protein LOC106154850 isoform X1 [Lingula anatina]|uniref:Uncharacterized protein LOC106154850 isoform X1 n=1 Tax=Lingula anatina TaxID=7574 RepID=A0A1S3HFG3_LINAN|nr:uncharacterized protein LOC106154850 isoform X1 [Lingula anatina]|eukprot:XP_013384818.1 uncharacterized protein LOC106154850 isoform X1 [Lingula anatina]